MRSLTLMVLVVAAGVILLAVKVYAWVITGSNAILADAMESIVNVVAGTFAAYTIHHASKPMDRNHPYGHGKMEFFSSGLEGSFIFIAGLVSVYRGVQGFFSPPELKALDLGAWLTAVSLLVNGGMGLYLLRRGKREGRIAIEADGKHLLSDAATSIGLLLGLIIILFTQLFWIDNVLSIIFGGVIIYSGYHLARRSVSGLMDEADFDVLKNVISHANNHRRENWVDVHKLRIQKFGNRYHIDAHLTLPYFMTLHESHEEVKAFEEIMESKYPEALEAFIHTDPCEPPASCGICLKHDCSFRKHLFIKRTDWSLDNVTGNQKHSGSASLPE
ncbi:MAG: cation transporter [Bacteroidia bacterium]|nr:cation transporter [Bacteroidia bacterium]